MIDIQEFSSSAWFCNLSITKSPPFPPFSQITFSNYHALIVITTNTRYADGVEGEKEMWNDNNREKYFAFLFIVLGDQRTLSTCTEE